MAFPIIPRVRSGQAGYPESLNLGELAVNTFDGSLFLGCDSGVAKINSVGVAGSTITEWTATEGQTVFTGINGYVDTADGSYLVSVGGVDQPGSAYEITSADSGTLTLASGAPAGVIVAVRAFAGGTGGGGGSTNATQLQGRAVSSATPNDADALVWSDANQDWEPAAVNSVKIQGMPIRPDLASVTNDYKALMWDGGQWTAMGVINGLEISANGTPAIGDALVFGSDNLWHYSPVNASQIKGFPIVFSLPPTDGQFLKFSGDEGGKWVVGNQTTATSIQDKAVGNLPDDGGYFHALTWVSSVQQFLLRYPGGISYGSGFASEISGPELVGKINQIIDFLNNNSGAGIQPIPNA